MSLSNDSLIISLATYNRRLPKIKKTFPTIVNQTVPYSAIIVNVQDDCTDEEFSEFKSLESFSPKVHVIKRPAKWRSFNKYLHVYHEYADSLIITCDDDIFYEPTFFEALYQTHLDNPSNIICHEVNPMTIDSSQSIRMMMAVDVKLLQTEFGKYMTGCCLFPTHIFDGSTIPLDDYDRFMELTDGVHDEIWLWVLSTLLGVQCICLDHTMSFDTDGAAMKADEFSLSRINGNSDNVAVYEERINSLYGDKLLPILKSVPCVFDVNRSNFMGVIGNMGWINRIFSRFNVVFRCDEKEILRSHLAFLVNAINSVKWYGKVSVEHAYYIPESDGEISYDRAEGCVAYVVDNNENQVRYLRNSVDTLKKHYNGDVFILTCGGFGYADRFTDCRIVTVTNDMISEYLPSNVEGERKEISYATFYRFLIPILDDFKPYAQVLYLDNDTEVVGKIGDIFQHTEKEFYGVNESWLVNEHNARLCGFKYLHSYCNAGVLLMNLFRLKDFKTDLHEMVEMQNRCNFRNKDQDMLNIKYDIGILDRKYNMYPTLEDTSNAVVLHYVNALKGILDGKIV